VALDWVATQHTIPHSHFLDVYLEETKFCAHLGLLKYGILALKETLGVAPNAPKQVF
jgi:hypothetical protein